MHLTQDIGMEASTKEVWTQTMEVFRRYLTSRIRSLSRLEREISNTLNLGDASLRKSEQAGTIHDSTPTERAISVRISSRLFYSARYQNQRVTTDLVYGS